MGSPTSECSVFEVLSLSVAESFRGDKSFGCHVKIPASSKLVFSSPKMPVCNTLVGAIHTNACTNSGSFLHHLFTYHLAIHSNHPKSF